MLLAGRLERLTDRCEAVPIPSEAMEQDHCAPVAWADMRQIAEAFMRMHAHVISNHQQSAAVIRSL